MRIPPPIIGAVTAGAMWLVAESTGLRIDVPASGFVALALIGLVMIQHGKGADALSDRATQCSDRATEQRVENWRYDINAR